MKILVFLFISFLILVIIYFSKIQVQIINFKFSSLTKRHINEDYKIIVRWFILSKIPIIKINVTKIKLEKLKIKEKIEKVDLKVFQEKGKFNQKMLKSLKKLNIQIININLNIEIGTENAALTSIIIPIVSTIIAIILRKKVKRYENQIFIINPMYLNQNLLNVLFSGIFEIKINHIINIIYFFNKKEGVDKHERTSNRRSYDYSYE